MQRCRRIHKNQISFISMKNSLRIQINILLFVLFPSCLFSQTDYSKIVNPFIGTGGHGHTFPGAVAPFGMVQLSPDTRLSGWDGCSGYHYSDSVIYGFSHTHLSGTGCSDWGDILIMPMMGEASFDNKIYSSKFSHSTEKAQAGFYNVHLEDDDIDVELTTTTRVGFHKYSFNKSGTVNFILDLLHRDKLLDGKIKIINNKTIEGFRRSEAWALDQRLYFRIEFSKVFSAKQIIEKDTQQTQAAFTFDTKQGEIIYVKVSISAVDNEGANNNMQVELPGWNFENTKQNCQSLWNYELNKIQINGGTTEQQIIFYTALYHCFIHPSIYNDVDGRYLGRDFLIHKTDGFNYYNVFSLWDTFRALHPLLNLLQRSRNLDFIKTFLEQYKQVGRLPMWELSSNETNCMIGYHAASVIADAYAKGIKNFDCDLALKAMTEASENFHKDLPVFNYKGCLSVEDEHESVSKNLEYCYNAFCVNAFKNSIKNSIGNKSTSVYWKNIFDKETGFMRARKNGGWYKPFNPFEVNQNYTEANAWQYSFFVPHDLEGLIQAHGGKNLFEKRLDNLFSAEQKIDGRQQADITGLIGQYAHGNEPSHNFAYLYNYTGSFHKTQFFVNKILTELYANKPDGLSGNEDCGQMSAWYVMSAIGLYSVCPGSSIKQYQLSTPLFNEITINSDESKLVLKSALRNENTFYIKETRLNNQKHLNSFLQHSDLFNYTIPSTTILEFDLSNKAESSFTFNENDPLKSIEENYIPMPIIETKSHSFKDSLLVSIVSNFSFKNKSNCKFMMKINKDEFTEYRTPFYIYKNTTIVAKIVDEKNLKNSSSAFGSFYKIPHNWSIQLNSKYNPQYTAGGDEGAIDGIRGDTNWRKGNWQGYWGNDFEAVINFNKIKNTNEISVGCLQDISPWIMPPKTIEIYSSNDGANFILQKIVSVIFDEKKTSAQTHIIKVNLDKTVKTSFIKIKAINFGKLPAWHESAGESSWLFIDEIEIK